jgi:hypothetical protein
MSLNRKDLTWSQISAFRLTRHHLADRDQSPLAAVCRDVCGIQAQVMSAAELQLWARIPGVTREEIGSALHDRRTLVKTSVMRQTLHLISADDFPIYISALRKSRVEAMLGIMSRFGIAREEADEMTESIAGALVSGSATPSELKAQIVPGASKRMRKYIDLAWGIQLFRLALVEGLICYGPDRGREATYVRVDQWLPKQPQVAESEAKRILLRRYLAAFGPATARDFSRWSGISMKESSPVWKSIEDELVEVTVEGSSGSILREDRELLMQSRFDDRSLRLLPYFDPYLLGHAGKDHLLDGNNYKRVYRNAGWISPTILSNGRVIGVWSHANRGRRLILKIEPFEKLTRVVRGRIEEEASRLEAFFETPCDVKFVEG